MTSIPVPLVPGTRLGPYEVITLIGAGGMGEVYRARDTNLRRDVALKILPDTFVHDPDRVARFRREAHLLAALNHPNIAHVYGLEDVDGANALVMELVEGPTLSERLTKGPIPIDEALAIARQIAEALEAAHEQGIMHRDLKPANVKVRDDGKVKVLDFGLAKAFVSDGPATDVSQAPTRTSDGTADGLMLGTPAYMSPEQLRGLAVDKRTDIWAFGCVLYQLLTGRKAFSGHTLSDVVAAILEREPNWEAVPAQTPAPIRRLLRRCLDKDRRRRLRDMGDALADLEEASDPRALSIHVVPSVASARLARNTLILATTVVAAAIVVAAVVVANLTRSSSPSVTRFPITVPGVRILPVMPALSPDGRTLVFAGCTKCDTENADNLVAYRRELDQLQEVPIPGLTGAYCFFFSPNGQWLGFCARDGLKKVPLAGGSPVTVYEGTVLGADWGADDSIVFASDSGLWRISADGTNLQRMTTPDAGIRHMSPTILPSNRVLFTVWEGPPTKGTAHIALVSPETHAVQTLVQGSGPRFLTTGHLIFGREGKLWAAPFDERRLRVGEAFPVMEGATAQPPFDLPVFAVARNGSLVYLKSDSLLSAYPKRSLVWVTPQGGKGKEEAIPRLVSDLYGWARVSPDRSSLALDIIEGPGVSSIWIYDIASGRKHKLTDRPEASFFPLWTQNGQGVVFTSVPPMGFFSQRADATGSPEHLLTPNVAGTLAASSWSHDGKMLVFSYIPKPRAGETPSFDIGVLTSDGSPGWKPLIHTDAAEMAPVISPDGAWIAYSSNQTGRFEIYAERFPGLGNRRMLSIDGGIEPLWSPSGTQVFYRSPDGQQVLAAPFDAKSGPTQGRPTVLFNGPYATYLAGNQLRAYDSDGTRFVMLKELPGAGASNSASTQLIVVLNWAEELKRLVPTK